MPFLVEVPASLLQGESGLLFVPAAGLASPQNNHTETVSIKSLLGPLALVSYWRIFTRGLLCFEECGVDILES